MQMSCLKWVCCRTSTDVAKSPMIFRGLTSDNFHTARKAWQGVDSLHCCLLSVVAQASQRAISQRHCCAGSTEPEPKRHVEIVSAPTPADEAIAQSSDSDTADSPATPAERRLAVRDAAFAADGCSVLCIGTQGEVVLLDSLSAATLHSLGPCLHRCVGAFVSRCCNQRVQDALVIDHDGTVCLCQLLASIAVCASPLLIVLVVVYACTIQVGMFGVRCVETYICLNVRVGIHAYTYSLVCFLFDEMTCLIR